MIIKRIITNVGEAFKYLREEMGVNEFEEMNEVVKEAYVQTITTLLQGSREDYLVAAKTSGEEDRCNGYYKRHLLTKYGDMEIEIPRTRKWSAINKFGSSGFRLSGG